MERVCVVRNGLKEKEISLPLVLHAKGAYTWRTRLVVLE